MPYRLPDRLKYLSYRGPPAPGRNYACPLTRIYSPCPPPHPHTRTCPPPHPTPPPPPPPHHNTTTYTRTHPTFFC